jgi:hypothetical protein
MSVGDEIQQLRDQIAQRDEVIARGEFFFPLNR